MSLYTQASSATRVNLQVTNRLNAKAEQAIAIMGFIMHLGNHDCGTSRAEEDIDGYVGDFDERDNAQQNRHRLGLVRL